MMIPRSHWRPFRGAWLVLFVCSASMFLLLMDSSAMFVGFPSEEQFSDSASRITLMGSNCTIYLYGFVIVVAGREQIDLVVGKYSFAVFCFTGGRNSGWEYSHHLGFDSLSLTSGVAIAMLSPSGPQ